MWPAKKTHWAILSVMLLLTFLFGIYFLLILKQEAGRKKHKETFLSTPLPQSVVDDLCSRGLVPQHISQCTGESTITRNDILEIFQSQIPPQATYDEVAQLFGKYEHFCAEDAGILRCYYTLGTPPAVLIKYDAVSKTIITIQST